ncbi:MAG: ribosomal protein S18-alanine N-acetyltransferase [Chloroflexota bacterium]
MEYTLRPMEEDDFVEIMEADREAFPTQPAISYSTLRRDLHSTLSHYLVAASSRQGSLHRVLGFISFWLVAGEIHVTGVAVRQISQRRGIGERLLISLLDKAIEYKANMATLEVRVSNLSAQSLYQKYGFEKVGIRVGYYSDNHENAQLMTVCNVSSATYRAKLKALKQNHTEKVLSTSTECLQGDSNP